MVGEGEGLVQARSYFVVFTHVDTMSTGNEWRVCKSGGRSQAGADKSKTQWRVEPCSCVVSTVGYVSGGVGSREHD